MTNSLCPQSRLPIPVFRNLFFGFKKPFLTGFLRISFFSCVFRRNFSQERGFGEVAGIPVFFRFYRNFSQEFLWGGIPLFSPDSSGFLRIPPDSSGFLFPPNAVWLRPADKFSPNQLSHKQAHCADLGSKALRNLPIMLYVYFIPCNTMSHYN